MKTTWIEEVNARYAKLATEKRKHRRSLELKYGTAGNRKSRLLYDKAWEYGHADGWEEVEVYYADLADLIKEAK